MRTAFSARAAVLALWIATACLSAGYAADLDVDPNEEDHEDHQALRKIKAVFEKAASENELDLLKPYLHDSFSAVTYTDREFTTFEAFKERWQKTRDEIVGTGSYKVTLLPVRSQIEGNLAICRGDSENILVNSAGKEFKFTSHWTAVCQKVDGKWKVLRAHSSLDPFGNPMLIDGVRGKLIQVGGGAGVGGLVLGGLLAFLATRMRRSPAPKT